MKCTDALTLIESPEFDAGLSMYSSTRAFFRAMAAEETVMDLQRQIHESGGLREEVLDRIYDLAALEIDPLYENPKDKSLAALLWVIRGTSPELVNVAAHYAIRAPKCWYTKKLAQHILASPLPTDSENHTYGFEAKCLRYENHLATDSTLNIMPVGLKLKLIPASFGDSAQSRTSEYTIGAIS